MTKSIRQKETQKGKILRNNPIRAKFAGGDILIPVLTVLIAAFGVLMVYSASSYTAEVTYGDAFFFAKKQLLGFILGLVALVAVCFFPYIKLKKLKWAALAISVVLLAVLFIPGVGKGISAVAELLTGSGILIKNGIGTAAFFCLVFFSLVPLLKLAVISFLYQLAAALLAPAADKRLLGCVDAMAAAVGMLLKMTGMTVLLFGLSIALVCVATSVK